MCRNQGDREHYRCLGGSIRQHFPPILRGVRAKAWRCLCQDSAGKNFTSSHVFKKETRCENGTFLSLYVLKFLCKVSLIETKQCLEDLYYKDLTRFGRILSSLPAVTEDTMISSPAPDVAMQDTVLWFCNRYNLYNFPSLGDVNIFVTDISQHYVLTCAAICQMLRSVSNHSGWHWKIVWKKLETKTWKRCILWAKQLQTTFATMMELGLLVF